MIPAPEPGQSFLKPSVSVLKWTDNDPNAPALGLFFYLHPKKSNAYKIQV